MIHLIFPHNPLVARPISGPSKKRVSVGSLCSEITHKNKWYYQPLQTKTNSIPTNHRQGVLWGFALRSGLFLLDARNRHPVKTRGELALFVWDRASNTNRSDVTRHQ